MRYHITIQRSPVVIGDSSDKKFVNRLRSGLDSDAIICANDFTAASLLKTLNTLKITVPGRVRVVGFDDVRYATVLPVTLTTVHQPCREIATTAFRAMQERIHLQTLPARTLSLAPRLVVRESCGAYRQ